METSISVVYYKYKTLSNGEHPLMLRVYKNGKRKLVSIGISIHPNLWDVSKNCPKKTCPNKELINKIIADKIAEYNKQILELKVEQKEYTAASLVESTEQELKPKTVKEFYSELIEEFKKNGKAGNTSIYTDSLNSLKAFTKNKLDFYFSNIDKKWLEKYEQWQKDKGNKETSISLQFRTLRSAYNKAIDAGVANKKFYPFDDYKISKFNTKTKKRAISKEEVMKIIYTETINATKLRTLTRDVFTFSYLCGGISFVDIANLSVDNICNGKLKYTRQKTHGEIKLKLCDQARDHQQVSREKGSLLVPDFRRQGTQNTRAEEEQGAQGTRKGQS